MFYPVKITCFDFLPWSTGNYSSPGAENDALADFHIALTRNNYMNWFTEWTAKEVNFIVFKNAVLTFLIIILFNVIYKVIKKEDFNKSSITLLIYFIISLLIWIITSPGIRFGVGIFLTFVLFISFVYKSEKSKFIGKNLIVSSMFYFIVLGLVPQTNNYFLYETFGTSILESVVLKFQMFHIRKTWVVTVFCPKKVINAGLILNV